MSTTPPILKHQHDNNKFKHNRFDINNPTFHSFKKEKGKDEAKNKFEEHKDDYITWASFFRSYPDRFLDLITPPDSKFRLFAFQRIILRLIFRYKYVFITATRGFSKSFLEILAFFLLCIFFPRIKLSITAGGSKEQAKNIASAKIAEILELYPILANEIKEKKEGKDHLEITFVNSSKLFVVGASNNSRGMRAHRGCIEECFLIDNQLLNEVIIPLFNIDRITPNGLPDPTENNAAQVYVTTAGFRDSEMFEKQLHFFKKMREGGSYICVGSSYELPMYHSLLKQEKVQAILDDPNYSRISFDREYRSKWISFSEKSFFKLSDLEKCRVVKKAELQQDSKAHPNDFFIMSYDSARVGGSANDASILCVFRCTERKDGSYVKNLVYMKSYEDSNRNNNDTTSVMHFKNQCLELKRHVEIFQPKSLVMDAQGNAQGLVDYLTDITEDIEWGKTYPPYIVVSINNEKQTISYDNKGLPILHLIKVGGASSGSLMNEMNNLLKGHIETQMLRLLVNENEAQQFITQIKKKEKNMELDREIELLAPYYQTTALIQELMQLEVEVSGHNIKLKPATGRMRKDRYSSALYGLYHICRYYEDDNKRNKNGENLEDNLYFFSF